MQSSVRSVLSLLALHSLCVAAPAAAQHAVAEAVPEPQPEDGGRVHSDFFPDPENVEPDAWSPPITWRASDGFYAAGIHATLMPDGRIHFMGFERDTFDPLQATVTRRSAFIFTPTPLGQPYPSEVIIANLTQPIDADNTFVAPSFFVTDQLYCAGQTLTADGDVFTAGGLRCVFDSATSSTSFFGLSYASLYDGASWTRVANDMTVIAAAGAPARYYPTCTRLSDGRILVTGGYDLILPTTAANLSAEAYDPATGDWTILSDYGATPAGIFNPDYTHPFVLPARFFTFYDLVMFGEDGVPLFFSLHTVPAWAAGVGRPGTLAGQSPNFGATTAMLPIRVDDGEWGYSNGAILIAGGSHNTSHQRRVDVYDTATNSWLPRVHMQLPRHHPTSVLLPDGRVLIAAGHDLNGDPRVRRTSTIDPARGFEHALGREPVPEITGYHHVAILLPDGRVLIGGGRDESTSTTLEKPTFRYYSPAYMFAERPAIETAPATVTLGQSFNVVTSGAKPVEVVLMGLGSMTHSFDANQRHVELAITANTPVGAQHSLTVDAPPDDRVAPPGHYMLFVLDGERVPSGAVIVKVL